MVPTAYGRGKLVDMAHRHATWALEHSQLEAERKERGKAERKARGNRLYAVLAWRPDARYSGKDVWRWFKRKADAEKWARGFNQGQGVVVREYTSLNDANAEWIPERAAKLVADFLGKSAELARHHATKKKSPAQLQREIDELLSAQPSAPRGHATKPRVPRFEPGQRVDVLTYDGRVIPGMHTVVDSSRWGLDDQHFVRVRRVLGNERSTNDWPINRVRPR